MMMLPKLAGGVSEYGTDRKRVEIRTLNSQLVLAPTTPKVGTRSCSAGLPRTDAPGVPALDRATSSAASRSVRPTRRPHPVAFWDSPASERHAIESRWALELSSRERLAAASSRRASDSPPPFKSAAPPARGPIHDPANPHLPVVRRSHCAAAGPFWRHECAPPHLRRATLSLSESPSPPPSIPVRVDTHHAHATTRSPPPRPSPGVARFQAPLPSSTTTTSSSGRSSPQAPPRHASIVMSTSTLPPTWTTLEAVHHALFDPSAHVVNEDGAFIMTEQVGANFIHTVRRSPALTLAHLISSTQFGLVKIIRQAKKTGEQGVQLPNGAKVLEQAKGKPSRPAAR